MPEQPTAPPPPPAAPPAAPTGWDPTTAPPESEQQPADADPTEHPQTTWICENPRCPRAGERRRVNWQHLGQGLYLVGTVRCGCGFVPVREPQVRR